MCCAKCSVLQLSRGRRIGERREEDKNELTLASSCAFPNINLKMKGIAGQSERYRGIIHTVAKGRGKKSPFTFGQQEENAAILL